MGEEALEVRTQYLLKVSVAGLIGRPCDDTLGYPAWDVDDRLIVGDHFALDVAIDRLLKVIGKVGIAGFSTARRWL